MVLCRFCVEEKGSSHGQDGPAGTPAAALKSYLSRLGSARGQTEPYASTHNPERPACTSRNMSRTLSSHRRDCALRTRSLFLIQGSENVLCVLATSQSSSMKDTTVLQPFIHRAGAAHKAHYQHTPLQSACQHADMLGGLLRNNSVFRIQGRRP
ncbi:hypothetical protein MHYP_G00168330 [Metynnis hypsauchen]